MKSFRCFFSLLFIFMCMALVIPVNAAKASVRTGTYEKHFVATSADDFGHIPESYHTVIINKITKKKVIFQICYDRRFPDKEAFTDRIIGKRKESYF